MTDHDHVFKELLGEFFADFIDLFFPQVSAYLDRTSLEFQPQEIFADLTEGDTYEADVVVKARFLDADSYFIVHLEHQGNFGQSFDRRMFNYFAQLHRIYQLPVYPIVLFSHRSPREVGDRSYRVEFSDWEVLRFNYRAIRLNHLDWRSYADQRNLVASALMSKMKMKRQERPLVKVECLRQMAQLRLNRAQTRMISQFVDLYLRLEGQEQAVFQAELDKLEASEKGVVMEVVTSWMQEGIEQGIERGIEQGRQQEGRSLVLLLLEQRVGALSEPMTARIEALSLAQIEVLAIALLQFSTPAELENWLQSQSV